ncbi:glycosyltransferase family 2 protein [Taibaiella koreensis]|uniref:glycosyltransferase family 2 protein n=1 Tax=Taibaiella koreensis TaxID=1268548 RepID=UPI000E5A06F8|nr:glycosyltransferase family 2 protein [Taibaiella koreensis]
MILDLVIPFYNPKQGWEQKLARRFTTLTDEHFGGDKHLINVIIVNDGSRDRFGETEIAYLRQHIPHLKVVSYVENKGKGHALRCGVAEALTSYCIYSDNDFPFGLGVIREMYNTLQQGADIVTGRRTRGNYFSHLPFKRKVISKGLAFVNRFILRLPVSDTQAGIKGFNRLGRKLFLQTTTERFLFDMEFILLAGRVTGIRIQEIDVNVVAGTEMTDFSRKVMQQEFRNLIRILLKKKNGKQSRKDII